MTRRLIMKNFALGIMIVCMAALALPRQVFACGTYCDPLIIACDTVCTDVSAEETVSTIEHIVDEFVEHREWMVEELFEGHILPAMMLMAEQLTAMAMWQVMTIGTFLDAKHQLETQRLFQQLMAEAHKDYQPSEGMCTFGTNVRSLAASDRNTELTAAGISARGLQRELLSGDALAGNGQTSDYMSRLGQFRDLYCNRSDNAGQLNELCPGQSVDPGRTNNDIDYTHMVDSPLTLRLDFTEAGDEDHAANAHAETVSPDEEDILALSANLYAHQVAPTIPLTYLAVGGQANPQGVTSYMDIRAIAAKRSVARNSFAAITAMKSNGADEVQPYLYAIMKEMGITDEEEIMKYLGNRPSYNAQMEILTKKLYQNPVFYTELYDKPANINRKTVAMQAIELMQRRDMYRSILRSEATLSVMLETALIPMQEQVRNELDPSNEDGQLIELP